MTLHSANLKGERVRKGQRVTVGEVERFGTRRGTDQGNDCKVSFELEESKTEGQSQGARLGIERARETH